MSNPKPPTPSAKPRSSVPVVIGGCLAAAILPASALLLMVILGGGGAFFFVLLLASIAFSSIAIHYVLWGWWLGPKLHEQARSESASDQNQDQQA
ncbi:MAG: hypothetical protein MI757_13915 [Pirellulales bacterium]|nr:hypothetical protein [Pirellulales bacterium]